MNILGRHPEPPPWLYNLLARGPLARRIYRRLVADLAPGLPPGARVLDVGTGPGYLLGYLAQERQDVQLWGLDLDYRMVRLARRKKHPPGPIPEWVVGDALALPFGDAVFDRVVASFSLHIWPDPQGGLKELRRLLKPGGRAWIYEMKRETGARALRAFSREEGLPFPLVYLSFKSASWGHSLGARDLTAALGQAGEGNWRLDTVHHLFWRGELAKRS
jgi:ubiquinone/menaquinone biosynthesis C-methylase UbiE